MLEWLHLPSRSSDVLRFIRVYGLGSVECESSRRHAMLFISLVILGYGHLSLAFHFISFRCDLGIAQSDLGPDRMHGSSPCGSYGFFVGFGQGGGISFLYGHCQSFDLSDFLDGHCTKHYIYLDGFAMLCLTCSRRCWLPALPWQCSKLHLRGQQEMSIDHYCGE